MRRVGMRRSSPLLTCRRRRKVAILRSVEAPEIAMTAIVIAAGKASFVYEACCCSRLHLYCPFIPSVTSTYCPDAALDSISGTDCSTTMRPMFNQSINQSMRACSAFAVNARVLRCRRRTRRWWLKEGAIEGSMIARGMLFATVRYSATPVLGKCQYDQL